MFWCVYQWGVVLPVLMVAENEGSSHQDQSQEDELITDVCSSSSNKRESKHKGYNLTSPLITWRATRRYRFVALGVSFSIFVLQTIKSFWITNTKSQRRSDFNHTSHKRVCRDLRLRTSGILWVSSSRPPERQPRSLTRHIPTSSRPLSFVMLIQ